MPSDDLRKCRKKHRYAFEFRYPPLIQAFDRRGKILENIHPSFINKIPHWDTKNVAVHFKNILEGAPTRQIFIDHHRTFLTYENDTTDVSFDEFYQDSKKLINKFFTVFPDNIENIKRVGVRLTSMFETRNFNNYADVIRKVKGTFFTNTFPMSKKITDFHISFKHEFGFILIGPVIKDDEWLKNTFTNTDTGNIPDYGLALDVDSFLKDISPHDLEKVFVDVFNASIEIEKEFVASIIS